MTELILDTLIDNIRLLPFLFLTYLVMEYLEHKTKDKTSRMVRRAGKWGPLIGGAVGIVPQCGFSAAASNLYAGRVISLGTLIAIYLSTSDEMLPILISEQVHIGIILKILFMKAVIGMLAGFLIDFFIRHSEDRHEHIHDMCEKDHCHCENGIIRSALHHTMKIFLFLVLITFGLNLVLHFVGEEALAGMLWNRPLAGPLTAALIGLVPNCAASVVITRLYLDGVMSAGAMMSGLLTGAGVGILVLCRVNHRQRENIKVIGLLYSIGVLSGFVIEWLKISF